VSPFTLYIFPEKPRQPRQRIDSHMAHQDTMAAPSPPLDFQGKKSPLPFAQVGREQERLHRADIPTSMVR